MKLLVLSDSHSALSFMRYAVDRVKPDGIVHLGDHYDDGEILKEEYPRILLWQVPGNCDRYRVPPHVPEILIERIWGVDFYMTHGHRHNVKLGLWKLLEDAGACNSQVVLFGHTHEPYCEYEDVDFLVMNPGSCGYGGGTVGLIEIEKNEIKFCRILSRTELEEYV